MAIDTKPNLSCEKFEQWSGDTLYLSGGTVVCGNSGILRIGDDASFCMSENAALGKVMTSDAYGKGTWQNTTSSASGDALVKEITQSSHGFVVGDVIGFSGGTYNKAIADGTYDGEVIGLVTQCVNANTFKVTQAGYVTGLTGLVTGCTYFLSTLTAGAITYTEPTGDTMISKTVLVATSDSTGFVLPYPGYVVSTGSTSGIISSSNGLTDDGTTVCLGGTLVGDTVIDLNNFKLCTGGYGNIQLSASTTAHLGAQGTNQNYIFINSGGFGAGMYFCSDTSGGGGFDVGMTLANRTNGLIYNACYSTGFTNSLSIVDKGYVDNAISAATSGITDSITGATNGLSVIDKNVVLGGAITDSAHVPICVGEILYFGCTNSGATLMLGNGSSPLTDNFRLQYNNSQGLEQSTIIGGPDGGIYVTSSSGLTNKSICFDFTNALQYGNDYSVDYTNRTLVDKGYVDNCVQQATSGITGGGITGATNGLSVNSANQVGLGGILTGDTYINLNSSRFHICNSSTTTMLCVDEGSDFVTLATQGGSQLTVLGGVADCVSMYTVAGVAISVDGGNDCVCITTAGITNDAVTISTNAGTGARIELNGPSDYASLITATGSYICVGANDVVLTEASSLSQISIDSGSGIDINDAANSNEITLTTTGINLNSGTAVNLGTGIGQVYICVTPNFGAGSDCLLVRDVATGEIKTLSTTDITGTTSAIRYADNGLTKIGETVVLGGALTGDTTINVTPYTLCIHSNTINGLIIETNNVCLGRVDGVTPYVYIDSNYLDIRGGNYVQITANTYVVTCTGMGGSIVLEVPNSSGLFLASGGSSACNVFKGDGINGLKYDSVDDGLSGWMSSTPKAIPDVQWVTAYTQNQGSGITGATNGLTDDGTTVCLGGALSNYTGIDLGSTYCLVLSSSTSNYFGQFDAANDVFNVQTNGGGKVEVYLNTACIAASTTYVSVDGGTPDSVCLSTNYGTNMSVSGQNDAINLTTVGDSCLYLNGGSSELYLTNGIAELYIAADKFDFNTSAGTYLGVNGTNDIIDLCSVSGARVRVTGNTINLSGVTRLELTPSGGTCNDSVLVWDSTDKQIKIVPYVSGGTSPSSASGENITKLIEQTSHGFDVMDVVGWSGGTYNLAIADGTYDGEIIGLVTKCHNANCFDLTQAGYVTGLTSLTANTTYFLSDVTAGLLTDIKPTITGHIVKSAMIADSTTSGWVLPYPAYLLSVSSGETTSLNEYTISGNSSSVGFVVNHGKNKQFVIVQVVEAASPYATVYTDVERPNANCVCVCFDTAPSTGTNYKILIIN